jgi:putative transposase
VDEKVDLVKEHRHDYGLNRCCEVLALSKGTWHYRMQREEAYDDEEAAIKQEMRLAIIDHPGYGYRRLRPELEARMDLTINEKRVRRLLGETNLGLIRQLPKHRPSGVQRILQRNKGGLDLVKGHTWDVLEVLSTDFTELRYAGGTKKAWFMAVVDIVGKWAPGWAIAPRRNRSLALECWRQAGESFEAIGRNLEDIIIHQDKDSVFTSYGWLRTLLIDAGASVSYSESGARDNPWIESMWGRIKTEIGSLITEAQTLEELKAVMDNHMQYYNAQRRHSAIDNQAPLTYLEQCLSGEDTALLHSAN